MCDVKDSLETLLNTIDAEIKQVPKRIDDLIDQNPDLQKKKELLKSIPGFSDKIASHILAEMHDLVDYESAKSVAAMCKLMHLAYGVVKNKQPFDPAYTG